MPRVIKNPDRKWYLNYLKKYYLVTEDGQCLFGSRHKGRDPSIVYYVVPDSLSTGNNQKRFDAEKAYSIFDIATEYLSIQEVLYQDTVMGYGERSVFLRHKISLVNPHSAYLGLFAKEMAFESQGVIENATTNIIIPETMPDEYVQRIKLIFPDYDPERGLTLVDLTGDYYRVLSLNLDYFGSAGKKPDLTLWWHIWENKGDLSDHSGSKRGMSLKGQSGTGKTTLTIGKDIRQDDAATRILERGRNGRIKAMYSIGAEAASFAKTEGLNSSSPEYDPIMSSKKGNFVPCLNVGCKGAKYEVKKVREHSTCVPVRIKNEKAGNLIFDDYQSAGTNNGRAIISFKFLNPNWKEDRTRITSDGMSVRHFGFTMPIFRIRDPRRAAAFVSACETINTGAVRGVKPGSPKVSPFATDFMAGEHADQTLLYFSAYSDIGLKGHDGGIIFFVNNSGSIGTQNPYTGKMAKDDNGKMLGEKITVKDSKLLVDLIESWNLKEDKWKREPVLGLWIPSPKYLEKIGLKDFCKRFNPLKFYTGEQIAIMAKKLVEERTKFLRELFSGQDEEDSLRQRGIIDIWKKFKIPDAAVIEDWYTRHFGTPEKISKDMLKYYPWIK